MTLRRFPSRAAGVLFLGALAGACSRTGREMAPLKVLLSGDILTLDPNQTVETVTDSVLFNVYQPLVGLDGSLEPRAMLAETWECPAPDRWRFHLRKNIRFHDGTLLTATLVRDALLAVQHDARQEASNFLESVKGIEAVSDDVLDLTTSGPRALLLSLFQVYITKPNSKGAFPPLVGTGPFKLRSWEKEERVVLEKWDRYWGKPAETPEVVFLPVSDPLERLARLSRGEADIAYQLSPGQPNVPLPPGIRLVRGGGLTVYYLVLNLQKQPFRDLRVREAFHIALNRQEIVDRAIGGIGTIANQPVSSLVFGYNSRLSHPPYDPERARHLMNEAGFGKGLKIGLDFPATRFSTAQLIQKSLKEIGVDLVLNSLPRNAAYELAAAGKSDLLFAGWTCSTGDASEFYEFCLHTRSDLSGHGNYGGYSNRRVDEIADQNAAMGDLLKRRLLLEEASEIAMKELPVLPLYVEGRIFGVRTGIEFTPPADGQIRIAELARRTR